MRVDLLHAQASVDWAVAQLPSFQDRLTAWIDTNVKLELIDLDPQSPDYMIVVVAEKELFPLAFTVEAGAYINAIRGSLDILATALAGRFKVPKPEDAYFPVAVSEEVFRSGGYKGAKFVQALPATERRILEELKPYAGGHELLWPLHQLDIMRKHRRLLSVISRPATFSITGWGIKFNPVAGLITEHDKAPIGFIAKAAFAGTNKPKMTFSAYIAIDETSR
jgi:hypothetical protein